MNDVPFTSGTAAKGIMLISGGVQQGKQIVM